MNDSLILDNAINATHQLGLKLVVQKRVPKFGNLQPDAFITLKRGKSKLEFVAEIKPTITPTTLGAVVGQLRRYADITKRLPLLIVDHVTVSMAERLKELGQQFVDCAGNAFLDGPDVLVWIVGRKPEKQSHRGQQGNLFTPANIKVLFALICKQELTNATHREIAAAANVALGSVTPALTALQAEGYIAAIQTRSHKSPVARNRRLVATRKLLDDWTVAYARTLWPKQLLRTFATPAFDDWQKWDVIADSAEWGGEPGAARLVGHLKPGILTLYADKVPGRLIVAQRLVTAESHKAMRTIEIRKRFWGANDRSDIKLNTVHPALIYADLLATGEGRCIDTAELIYDSYLAKLFPQA